MRVFTITHVNTLLCYPNFFKIKAKHKNKSQTIKVFLIDVTYKALFNVHRYFLLCICYIQCQGPVNVKTSFFVKRIKL